MTNAEKWATATRREKAEVWFRFLGSPAFVLAGVAAIVAGGWLGLATRL